MIKINRIATGILVLLIAAAAHGQQKERRLLCCMYTTPMPMQVKGLHPIYTGVAVSDDRGTSWKSTGWRTNRTNDIASDPADRDRLYLANDYGLLVSSNGGATWKLATDERIPSVLAVETSGDTVLLGAPTGVFLSRDRGGTFVQRNGGLTALNGTYVSGLLLLPGMWFAATADGIYRSTDAGAQWKPAGLQGKAVDRVLHSSSDPEMFAAFNSRDGIWTSADRGKTWVSLAASLPTTRIQALLLHPTQRNVLFAGTQDQGVLRSSDGGATWKNVSAGMENLNTSALAFDVDSESILWAGAENGAYISRDGGNSWAKTSLRLGAVSAIRMW